MPGSQTPGWQPSGEGQARAAPGTHVPAAQASSVVQALPSEQAVPSARAGLEQTPVDGSQVPGAWHWSGVGQVTAGPPLQTPAAQASPVVQASPSEQAVPSARAGLEQAPVDGSQVPGAWHWSGAGQVTAGPPLQTPATQASRMVQALPSSHAVPSAAATCTQLPVALHASAVHGSPSSQLTPHAPHAVGLCNDCSQPFAGS